MDQEGELVETGTFRVDTSRMQEVLARYQLQRPEQFAAAWLRCASACAAKSMRLARAEGEGGTGFEFSFDGAPLPAADIEDFNSGLLSGGNAAGRFFSAGLLALQRTEPASVMASSGGIASELSGGGQRSVRPPADGGRTSLHVLWRAGAPGLPFTAVQAEFLRCLDLCAASFTCSGDTVGEYSSRAVDPAGLYFDSGGRRGAVYRRDHTVTPLAGFHPEQDSMVGIHVLGVRAESLTWRMPLAPVKLDLNDDTLDLDVTMSACVKNEKYEALTAYAEDRVRDLVIREIARQRNALEALGAALGDPQLVRLWRARMKHEEAWQSATTDWKDAYLPEFFRQFFPGRPPLTPAQQRLYDDGFRYWWLQDACRRVLKGLNTAPEVPWLRTLWEAPVMLSCEGELLGLADLHRRWIKGMIKVSRSVAAERISAGKAVWLASARDERFLNEWIPKDDWGWV